jgi:hypothetical protein
MTNKKKGADEVEGVNYLTRGGLKRLKRDSSGCVGWFYPPTSINTRSDYGNKSVLPP